MSKSRRVQPLAEIYGITVDKITPRGCEIIIIMSRDPQLEPIVVRTRRDLCQLFEGVAFRLIPMNERDAQQMVE
jgi:hypothetical protein